MIDTKEPLRKAYITRLNGNLTISGSNVPVKDRVPNNISYPYVKIGEQTSVDESNKTTYLTNNTIILDIVTGFGGNHGGKKQSDDIADQILVLIRTRSSGYMDLSSDGLDIITTTLDDDRTIEEETETHYIYRRLLTFRHLIEEI